MICHNCGFENPEGRRYCEECNEKLREVEHEREVSKRRTDREAARIRREAEAMGLDADVLGRRRRVRSRWSRPWVGLVVLGVLAAVVVMVIVMATSESLSAPEKTVQGFFGAIEKKDVMGFLKNTTEVGTYEQVKKGEIPQPEVDTYIGYDRYQVDEIKTELLSEQGDQAEVRLIGGWFQGFWSDDMAPSTGVDFAQYPRIVKLVKYGDKWVIANYSEVMLPAPMPENFSEESEFPELESSP